MNKNVIFFSISKIMQNIVIKEKIRLALVQVDIAWEDKKKNLEVYTKMLLGAKAKPDLIILPEMFQTGFTLTNVTMAEGEGGMTIQWMRDMAKQCNAVITGSIMFSDKNKLFNRLIWMEPSGEWQYYDKRHLFSVSGENIHFTSGHERQIFNLCGWKILPLICYDLRFPVWSRNSCNYDLLIYCANWPASRQFVWDILLTARALENQAFVCGVNRTGADMNNISYKGGSVIINPHGEKILTFRENEEDIKTCSVSKQELTECREKFPVLKDRDEYQLIL